MSLRKVKDIGKARKKGQKGGWGYKKVTGTVYEPVRLSKKKQSTSNKSKTVRPPTTKKFGKGVGSTFTLIGTRARSKKAATERAERERKRGYNARVAKVEGGYAAYRGNKTKKRTSKKLQFS